MKSTTALALAALLSFPPPVTAQGRSDLSWARVQRIKAGRTATVTVRDSPPVPRIVIGATADHLMVLNFSNPGLPRPVKAALLDLGRRGMQDFVNMQSGSIFKATSGVRIGLDGLFVNDIKVADLAEVVERIERVDVRLITISRRSRWSAVGAVVGGTVGVCLGVLMAYGAGISPALSLLGVPGATSLVGYAVSGGNVVDRIYQAPPVSP